MEKAPFLFLFIRDVERGQDRCRAVGPAIGANQEGECDAKALRLLRGPDGVHQLVADDEGDVRRKHGGQRAHMFDHRERIGREPIGENDQPEQRKQREEAVESNAGRDEADIVVPHALVGPKRDVLPRGARHLPRRARLMSLGIDHRPSNLDRLNPVPRQTAMGRSEHSCQGRKTGGRWGFRSGARAPHGKRLARR